MTSRARGSGTGLGHGDGDGAPGSGSGSGAGAVPGSLTFTGTGTFAGSGSEEGALALRAWAASDSGVRSSLAGRLAVAALVLSACTRPAAGPVAVSFEFVDAEGAPWREALAVRLTPEATPDAGSVSFTWTSGAVSQVLAPGTWHVVARRTLPPSSGFRCGTIERPTRLDTTFEVSGPTSQRFELGASRLEAARLRATQRIERWLDTREVRLELLAADGGPAAHARAHCDRKLYEADEDGRVACEVRGRGALPVRVFNGPEWAEVELDGGVDEAVLRLQPGLQVNGSLIGVGPADEVSFTVNSKNQIRDERSVGPRFTLEGLKAERVMVCAFAAVGSACDVLSPDAGPVQDVTWAPGPGAALVLHVTHRGAAVKEPVVYVNRMRFPGVQVDGGVRVLIQSGRSVLVINAAGTPDRAEQLVSVAPGQTLAVDAELLPPGG